MKRAMRDGALARTIAGICLTLALAACGSSGGGAVDEDPRTQPTPTSSDPGPTPAPTTTSPVPTATGPQVVAAMRVAGFFARSVNQLGWIAVDGTSPRVPRPRVGTVVLAPDAGPEAVPPPAIDCLRRARDGSCAEHDVPVAVADPGWVLALREGFGPDGWSSLPPVAYGPDGEPVPLVDPRRAVDGTYGGIRLGPGPLFTGTLAIATSEQTQRIVPLLWRTAGRTYQRLDTTGFSDGLHPAASDAAAWIVGSADGAAGPVPVLWRPQGDDWLVERLPLLGAATRGSAADVDDGRIVGWSEDDEGMRAVVWQASGDGFEVAPLPLPPGAVACASATAISGPRVVGHCEDAERARLAVVWRSTNDGSWRVEALLAGLEPDQQAGVTDISGDLAVGGSTSWPDHTVRALAWRLPAPREE